jgi:hypothetical protein
VILHHLLLILTGDPVTEEDDADGIHLYLATGSGIAGVTIGERRPYTG